MVVDICAYDTRSSENMDWRHQAITWSYVDLPPVRPQGIRLRASSEEDLKTPISKKIENAFLKSHPDFPGPIN